MLRQGLSIMHAGAEGKEKVRDPQSETVHNESVPSPFLLPEGRDHITRNLQGAPFRRPPCLVVGNAGAHLRVRILRSGHAKHSASRLRGQAFGHAGLPTAEDSDTEMSARIAHHQARRPSEWGTLEVPCDVVPALREEEGGWDTLIVD